MKDVYAYLASFMVVVAGIVFLLGLWGMDVGRNEWTTRLSPETSICYEVRTTLMPLGIGTAISPVDDRFCEDK